MSTGAQAGIDGWDIHGDKNGKGKDSSSNREGRDTSHGKTTVFVGLGNEVGADTQDDEGEAEDDAWK